MRAFLKYFYLCKLLIINILRIGERGTCWQNIEIEYNKLSSLGWLQVDLTIQNVTVNEVWRVVAVIHYHLEGIQTTALLHTLKVWVDNRQELVTGLGGILLEHQVSCR